MMHFSADGPEINDQYVTKNEIVDPDIIQAETETVLTRKVNTQSNATQDGGVVLRNGAEAIQNSTLNPQNSTASSQNQLLLIPQRGVMERVYLAIYEPLNKILEIPKVMYVIKNVGTCVVNGFMEIVSYYLPPPLIPLVASLAGMFIPFEPVVQLKRRNPVESYRRALSSAVNSFMGTFNQNGGLEDEDPYMTRRFNSKYGGEKTEKQR